MILKSLFSQQYICNMKLKNRIIFPAIASALSEPEGIVSERLIDYHIARVKGGCGLNIVELSSGQKEPLAITGTRLYDFSWSPNSKKIAYISTWSSFYHRMLFVLDVETGETKCLTCKLLLALLD